MSGSQPTWKEYLTPIMPHCHPWYYTPKAKEANSSNNPFQQLAKVMYKWTRRSLSIRCARVRDPPQRGSQNSQRGTEHLTQSSIKWARVDWCWTGRVRVYISATHGASQMGSKDHILPNGIQNTHSFWKCVTENIERKVKTGDLKGKQAASSVEICPKKFADSSVGSQASSTMQ